jgi:cytochrome c
MSRPLARSRRVAQIGMVPVVDLNARKAVLMTKIKPIPAALAAAILLVAGAARAAGDAKQGEQVFKRCLICHTVAAGQPNRLGPNLHGLFDRAAGTAPGFNYSPGLAKAGYKWDDEKLDKWLENPQAFIAGARMSFRLGNAKERADVIAYLHEATK